MRLGLLVAASLLSACAVNPITGGRSVVLISEEQERALGAEEAKRVEASMGLVDEHASAAYVQAIGARLAGEAPGGAAAYRFYVADMEVPNAFALPGGHVYVSRGLLALVNSEAELAGVIGHEIGHVVARHAAARMSAGILPRVVTGIGALTVGIVSPTLGGVVAGLGGLTSDILMNPYNRQQEREADEIGQKLAAAAGWDPAGLPAFLGTLADEERLARGSVRRISFLSSHPATPERVRDTEARVAELTVVPRAPIARGRNALLAKLEELVIGKDPRGGIVDGQSFLHPDFDFAMTFPERWTIRNAAAYAEAVPPDEKARIILELAGEGRDPMAAARAFFEQHEAEVEVGEVPSQRSVHGRPAAHATARLVGGRTAVRIRLMWVATGRHVVLASAATPASRFEDRRPELESVLETFRPLTSDERTGIEVTTLEIVRPRASERLADVATRVSSAWPPAVLAMANQVDEKAPLSAGDRIKVAIRRPYRR